MSLLLVASSALLAAEPTPTRPVDSHHSALTGVSATPQEAWGGQATLGGTLGASLRVDQALGSRMFAHGSVAFVGGLGTFQGMVGGRFVEHPNLRVAAYAGVAGIGAPDGEGAVGPGAGLAVDAGTRNVRVEASMPVLVDVPAGEVYDRPWLLGSVGARVIYTDHQQIRVGVDPGRIATASWAYVADHWHVGAGAGYYASGPMAHLSVGAAW